MKRIAAILVLGLAACSAPAGVKDSVILSANPASKLSDYGLFRDAAGREPAEGVTPYDLVNPLFTDYAGKHRLVYVPKGAKATYNASQVLEFPVGTVLIKTFAFAPDMRAPAKGERYVETRLLIRKTDGWAAYPYIWNAEGTEAVYSPVGGKQTIQTVTPAGEAVTINYAVPNKNQCKECHSKDKVLTPIGPTARNLNHAGPQGMAQLADWVKRGILDAAPADAPAAPPAFGDGPLNERARAWLDINCAHCHRAGGSASNSGLVLGWNEADVAGWGVRKRPVAAGRGSGDLAFVIEPGKPEESILLHRIDSTETGIMMPELGRTLVDRPAVELIRQWIAAMPPAK